MKMTWEKSRVFFLYSFYIIDSSWVTHLVTFTTHSLIYTHTFLTNWSVIVFLLTVQDIVSCRWQQLSFTVQVETKISKSCFQKFAISSYCHSTDDIETSVTHMTFTGSWAFLWLLFLGYCKTNHVTLLYRDSMQIFY